MLSKELGFSLSTEKSSTKLFEVLLKPRLRTVGYPGNLTKKKFLGLILRSGALVGNLIDFRGGTHHKRLLLGISLDGQVGIRQVCRSITAHIRNPVFLDRKSDKHAWSWLQENGWISIVPLAWRHPSLKARLEPKKGWEKVDRKIAAHDLRESWRWVEWSRLTTQTKRHQNVEYQNELFDAEGLKSLRSEVASAQGPKRMVDAGGRYVTLGTFANFWTAEPTC